MAEKVGSIFYDLDLDDSKFKKGATNVDSTLSKLGNSFKQAEASSLVLVGALAAVGTAFIALGVSSVKSFMDSQDAIAQTNAVLKSTKGIAGVTEQAVDNLASKFQSLTRYSDEEIRSGENLLLTFTNIGKKIFPQATETILNMSTALGQDLKGSAIQLGKALQDPILGVTALRRVGVNFSDAQQEVIKKLVETNQLEKAQALILQELNTEFGGAAEAAGGTFAGKLAILKNKLDDLKEGIGGIIVNALTPIIDKFNTWLDKLGGVDGIMKNLKKTIEENHTTIVLFAGALTGMLIPGIVSLTSNVLTLAGTFTKSLGPWGLVFAGIALVVDQIVQKFGGWEAVIKSLKEQFKPVEDAINSIVESVKKMFGEAQKDPKGFLNSILGEKDANLLIQLFNTVKGVMDSVGKTVKPVIDKVINSIGGFIEKLGPIGGEMFGFLRNIFETVLPIVIRELPKIVEVIKPLVESVGNFLSGAFETLGNIVSWLWTNILQPVFAWISANIGPILNFIIPIIQTVIGVIVSVVTFIINNLVPVIQTIWTVIQTVFNAIGAVISWVWNTILKPIFEFFYNIITGLIIPMFQNLWAVAQVVWQAIKDLIEMVWLKIRVAIDPVIKFFRETVMPIWEQVKKKMETAWNSIKDTVTGVWDGIKGAVKNGVNGVIDWMNGFIDKLNDLIKKASDALTLLPGGKPITFRIGHIAKLATGTNFVPQDMLAYIHQGEAVVPKAYNPNAGGSGGQNYNFTFDLSGIIARSRGELRDIASDMINAVNEDLASRNLPLLGNGNVKGLSFTQ